MKSLRKRHSAFTLAELLIALLLIGEIATFTIPKVISAQQNSSNNAKAKEVAGMLAGAFQQYQQSGRLSGSSTAADLLPYLNYVSYHSSGALVIDDVPSYGSKTCLSNSPCIRLHSGAVVYYQATWTFGGTSSSNYIDFIVDPDGYYSNSTTGSGKSVKFSLFYNGRLTTMGVQQNDATLDPSWFQW